MRLYAIVAFVSVLWQLGSAIPLVRERNNAGIKIAHTPLREAFDQNSRNLGNSEVLLEARGNHGKNFKQTSKPKPPPPAVTFRKGGLHDASNALDNLNLHADKRKETEEFHKKIALAHMPPNAHSAEIVNLAHSKGSRDPKIHVSVQYKDKSGNIVQVPRFGDPKKHDDVAHIYLGNPHDFSNHDDYNKHALEQLPHPFKKAVINKALQDKSEEEKKKILNKSTQHHLF